MSWIRFPVWDKWGNLTRFWIAAEAAFAAEHARWTAMPVQNPSNIVMLDPTGDTKFKCNLDDYKSALLDEHKLYAMLLCLYTGLIEEHGRNMIEYAISVKKRPRSDFPGLDPNLSDSEAAEEYIKTRSVEAWGIKILQLGHRTWSDVPHGGSEVVQCFVIRNIVSHGLSTFTQTAFNRISNFGITSPSWSVGDKVVLDRSLFRDCVQSLRSFGRIISDIGAHLP